MTIFTEAEKQSIKNNSIPKHVAIIPDGNRRWAKKHLLSAIQGHHQGCDRVIEIIRAAKELSIKTVTFYTFSTENWQRPKAEVNSLMHLLETYLIKETPNMVKNDVRLHTIGNSSKLPDSVKIQIDHSKNQTAHCRGIDCILALNYGSREEICRNMQQILDDYAQNKIKKEDLTEEKIGHYLDTKNWPDPDLLIRTSGEKRVSNFLLWQIAYTELYFTDVLWPNFTPQHFLQAVTTYQSRQKRYGG